MPDRHTVGKPPRSGSAVDQAERTLDQLSRRRVQFQSDLYRRLACVRPRMCAFEDDAQLVVDVGRFVGHVTAGQLAQEASLREAIVAFGGDMRGTRWGRTLDRVGAAFVSIQAYEYTHAYSELNLKLSSGIYGSTFFMLTGFHGMHVTGGVIYNTCVLSAVSRGQYRPAVEFFLLLFILVQRKVSILNL